MNIDVENSRSKKQDSAIKLWSGPADKLFMGFIYLCMAVIFIVIIVPLLFVLASSFSSPDAITAGKVYLWPVDFSVQGYKIVFSTPTIMRSFFMSVFYTFFGTFINVAITLLAAYPLTRKDLKARNFFMMLFTITMFVNGGMIPSYLVVRALGMVDTVWAILIPSAMSVWNLILTRTYIQNSIPVEMYESASIDGCSDFRYFWSIVIPLSVPIIAVIVLLYAVGRWNSFFDALIYLNKTELQPLPLVLRSILAQNTSSSFDMSLTEQMNRSAVKNLLQYSLIVVATVPILCLYPFIQRYFIKGIMVGSIKG